MKLYSYWRSTTSYRVRIALHLKGIAFETTSVNLVNGEQHESEYRALNPIGGVPSLVLNDSTILTQSMAILDYLDQTYPKPALLPEGSIASAKIKAAAFIVASDIHPVNNLKVGAKLKQMGHEQDEVVTWMNDWMVQGFTAYHALLPDDTEFSFGNSPSLADLCLVPQLYNAHRWGTDLTPFKRLTDIEHRCLQLPAFDAARPENQPDANQTTN